MPREHHLYGLAGGSADSPIPTFCGGDALDHDGVAVRTQEHRPGLADVEQHLSCRSVPIARFEQGQRRASHHSNHAGDNCDDNQSTSKDGHPTTVTLSTSWHPLAPVKDLRRVLL